MLSTQMTRSQWSRKRRAILQRLAKGQRAPQIAKALSGITVYQVNAVKGNAALGFYNKLHRDLIKNIYPFNIR